MGRGSRNAVADRLCKLMFHLPALGEPLDGQDLNMLASWCSCTRRTLYRDLEALRKAGFKVPRTERRAA
jgi:predicted DNA-binding transcriptional regulator YafY